MRTSVPRPRENQHFWAVQEGGRRVLGGDGAWGPFAGFGVVASPRVLLLPVACCSGGRARGEGRWSVTRRRLLLLTSPHHVFVHPRSSCTLLKPLLLTFLHHTLISALPHHALHTPALLLHTFFGHVLLLTSLSAPPPLPSPSYSEVPSAFHYVLRRPVTFHYSLDPRPSLSSSFTPFAPPALALLTPPPRVSCYILRPPPRPFLPSLTPSIHLSITLSKPTLASLSSPRRVGFRSLSLRPVERRRSWPHPPAAHHSTPRLVMILPLLESCSTMIWRTQSGSISLHTILAGKEGVEELFACWLNDRLV